MSLTKEKLDELIRNSFLNATNSFLKDCLSSESNTVTLDPVRPGSDPVRPGPDPVRPGPDPVRPGPDPVAVDGDRVLSSIPTDHISHDSIEIEKVIIGKTNYEEILSDVTDDKTSDFLFKGSGRNKSIQELICTRIKEKQSDGNAWAPVENESRDITGYKMKNLFKSTDKFKGLNIKAEVIVDNSPKYKQTSYVKVTLIKSKSKSSAFNILLDKIIKDFKPVYSDPTVSE